MKRTIKTLALLLAAIMIIGILPFSASADTSGGNMTVMISSVKGYAGNEVNVTISFIDNPGISSAAFYVNYDNTILTLESVSFEPAIGGSTTTSKTLTSPAFISWVNGTSNISGDFVFATLKFKIAENAGKGRTDITLSYDPDNIYNINEANISCLIEVGSVTVIKYKGGDINGDDKINNKDVSRLMQYIAHWDVEAIEATIDCNGDGKINNKDITRLMQYIAGWDVQIYVDGVPEEACDHRLEAYGAVEATCVAEGHYAYWYCAECGKYFSDSEGKIEVLPESMLVPATGHNYVNGVCSICGSIDMPVGTVCTIQYNVGMINSNDPSEVAKISNDTYIVGTAKALPVLKMDTYTFIGWTDQNGNFYANNIIPKGVTGDLILNDNWVSLRNQAKAKTKLDNPLVVEDPINSMIYFGYEIGTIENVPLYTTQNLLCVNGVISVKENTTQHTLTKSEMNTVGSTISKETIGSTQVTLSQELTDMYEVDTEKAKSMGYDTENVETYARSQTNTQSYSTSSGGSSENYVYNDSTHRSEVNAGYVINENFDTGASFELKTGFKNTTEASAGVSFPVNIISVNAGVKNTTDVSLDTDSKMYMDYSVSSTTSWDGHTYDESYQANSTTDTKTWNSTSAQSTAMTASKTNTISEAFHEMIAETYRYGESYSSKHGNSSVRGLTQSNGQTDENCFTVTYIEQEILTETNSFTTTGNTFGSYRLVMMGTIHVFAIVGYDVAKGEYFVYTLNVLGDGSKNDGMHEEIDYSYDRSFSDYENSVIPFEIPMYVEHYVNSRITSTAGLEYEFDNKNHTATVESYIGTDKIVYVPSFVVDDEGTAYKVTAIKASAFKGNTNIVAVSLGRYVSIIPDAAFKGCTNLEYVICPAVTSIGREAFFGCTSMKEFRISKQITHLGVNAFEGVPAVSIDVGYYSDIPNSAKEIAENGAACGADSIVLNISDVPAETELNLNMEQGKLFVLNGGEKTFANLRLVSKAIATRLESVNICLDKGIPVQLYSENVTLYKTEIETGTAYAVLLACNVTEVILSGTNTLRSAGNAAMISKSISVDYANSGKLKLDGDLLLCGAISGKSNRIEFIFDSRSVLITEEEFARYQKGVFTVTLMPGNGALSEDDSNTLQVYYGEAIGKLPVPTRDYYTFNGWYTEESGGTKVTAETLYETANNMTLYAHWTIHPIEGWVKASDLPSGAEVISRKWSYNETTTTESTSTSLDGYTQYGSYWVKSGEGHVNYATFPSGFDTSHKIYTSFARSPYTESETATTKREVKNVWGGYVYWHWMYNVTYSTSTERAISNKYVSSNSLAYVYFYALTSTVNCPYLDNYYCNSANLPSYNCVNILPASTSSTDGMGTPRFFRFEYNTSYYTDYYKMFQYTKTESKETTSGAPTGSNISDIVEWVQYRAK